MRVNGQILSKIPYEQLNARQQERFNYQKASALLADYGLATYKLDDDWNGADFIAQHISQDFYLKIQLKGRLTFGKKYVGKDIYVMFRDSSGVWYMYPHDECLEKISANHNMMNTESWRERGGYSIGTLSQDLKAILDEYRVGMLS